MAKRYRFERAQTVGYDFMFYAYPLFIRCSRCFVAAAAASVTLSLEGPNSKAPFPLDNGPSFSCRFNPLFVAQVFLRIRMRCVSETFI